MKTPTFNESVDGKKDNNNTNIKAEVYEEIEKLAKRDTSSKLASCTTDFLETTLVSGNIYRVPYAI